MRSARPLPNRRPTSSKSWNFPSVAARSRTILPQRTLAPSKYSLAPQSSLMCTEGATDFARLSCSCEAAYSNPLFALTESRAASALRRGTFMTRALLCSVLLLSLSCSSGSSDNGDNTGGNGNTSGSGNQTGGSSGSVGTSGSGNNAGSAGAGTAGMSNGGAGGTGSGTTGASVTQWGGDIARSAHYVAPSLTKASIAAMPSKMQFDTFTAPAGGAEYAGKFAGEVAAIPLYLAGATAGAGEYIVSTTQNDVYAFNESTGALLWKHNVGANLGQGTSACGTPTNHGIVGTPVIDATSRVIYLAAGMADAHKEIHALNADTGMEMPGGWPVDVSKFMVAGVPFLSTRQSQRSALSLVAGVV